MSKLIVWALLLSLLALCVSTEAETANNKGKINVEVRDQIVQKRHDEHHQHQQHQQHQHHHHGQFPTSSQ
ncbi:hypothetical protein CHUAL_007658 [Chamberlinius hualienensis]